MARPKGSPERAYAAFRIPADVGQLWEDTAKTLGLTKTATLILAIKKLARAEGIPERPLESREEKTDHAG